MRECICSQGRCVGGCIQQYLRIHVGEEKRKHYAVWAFYKETPKVDPGFPVAWKARVEVCWFWAATTYNNCYFGPFVWAQIHVYEIDCTSQSFLDSRYYLYLSVPLYDVLETLDCMCMQLAQYLECLILASSYVHRGNHIAFVNRARKANW